MFPEYVVLGIFKNCVSCHDPSRHVAKVRMKARNVSFKMKQINIAKH